MTSENEPTPDSDATAARKSPRRRSFLRRFIFPALVIAAIVATIYWIDYQKSGNAISQSGARYGPVDVPSSSASPALSVGTDPGQLAPDFILEGLDGIDVRLSDLRGKAVVINFWATWCRPCRQEMPNLVKAYEHYKGQGLVIVGVDEQEGKSIIQPFATDFGIDYPIAIDRTGRVGDKYRLLGLPTSYFVDRNGVIRSSFSGPFLETANGTNVQGAIDATELTKRIEEILAGP